MITLEENILDKEGSIIVLQVRARGSERRDATERASSADVSDTKNCGSEGRNDDFE